MDHSRDPNHALRVLLSADIEVVKMKKHDSANSLEYYGARPSIITHTYPLVN